jgi:hypothetical protein
LLLSSTEGAATKKICLMKEEALRHFDGALAMNQARVFVVIHAEAG